MAKEESLSLRGNILKHVWIQFMSGICFKLNSASGGGAGGREEEGRGRWMKRDWPCVDHHYSWVMGTWVHHTQFALLLCLVSVFFFFFNKNVTQKSLIAESFKVPAPRRS